MGKESYPKLVPGAFLFDPVTGYLVQVVCYHRDPENGNKLVTTRPSRSLAETSIKDFDASQDYLSSPNWASEEMLSHVRSHSLLVLEEQSRINSFISTCILVSRNANPKHKFLRPDSFYDDYVVSETWAKKNGVDIRKTWRVFPKEWGFKLVQTINYKGFTRSLYIMDIVNGMKEVIFKGIPRMYSIKRFRDE